MTDKLTPADEALGQRILDALHEQLPYPTEACAIVRTVLATLPPEDISGDARKHDLIWRLRSYKLGGKSGMLFINPDGPEAATEIERLRAIEDEYALVLRKALERIVKEADTPRKFWSERIGNIARTALAAAPSAPSSDKGVRVRLPIIGVLDVDNNTFTPAEEPREVEMNIRAPSSALDEGVRKAAQAVVDCYGVGWAADYQAFAKAVGPFILRLREALSTPSPTLIGDADNGR